ncbi:MAG: lysophospholipase [Pseudonocardiales bacterium]|nr:MAG: lysophospholipase [Pseudonocardiales bacterium]
MTVATTEDDLLETFVLDGDVPLAVRIHRPPGAGTTRQPGVVVMGSWLTVKEQMADTYAAELAEQGITAVTFDFAGFGASGGVLRQAEIPVSKIRNLAAVVDFMRTLSVVDPGRLGVLAVCASAQYALGALDRGLPVDSFASVAGWFHDLATVSPFYGGDAGVAERLRRSTIASRSFAESGDLSLVPAYGPGDDTAGMSMEMDYYASPERGNVPQWRNEMSEVSWAHWLQYDAFAAAEGVRVPSLFVHSEDAVLPDNVRRLAAKLGELATMSWTDGAQTDFYDQRQQVDHAITAAVDHFTNTWEKSA